MLDFDISSLRIVDAADTDDSGNVSAPTMAANILHGIKGKSKVTKPGETLDPSTGEITKAPQAEIQATMLKNMLNGLKTPIKTN
jgi:hypothetical protein